MADRQLPRRLQRAIEAYDGPVTRCEPGHARGDYAHWGKTPRELIKLEHKAAKHATREKHPVRGLAIALPHQADIARLRLLELSDDEIAARLGITPEHVAMVP